MIKTLPHLGIILDPAALFALVRAGFTGGSLGADTVHLGFRVGARVATLPVTASLVVETSEFSVDAFTSRCGELFFVVWCRGARFVATHDIPIITNQKVGITSQLEGVRQGVFRRTGRKGRQITRPTRLVIGTIPHTRRRTITLLFRVRRSVLRADLAGVGAEKTRVLPDLFAGTGGLVDGEDQLIDAFLGAFAVLDSVRFPPHRVCAIDEGIGCDARL